MSSVENNLSNLPNLSNQEKFNVMSLHRRCYRCNRFSGNCRCYRKKKCVCCMIIKCVVTCFLIYIIIKLMRSNEYNNYIM